MTMLTPSNFHAAKPVIRKALDEASRETLLSLLEAARAGKVPYFGALRRSIDKCGCLTERLTGKKYNTLPVGAPYSTVSCAYGNLVPHASLEWVECQHYDHVRQRVLVTMVRAALKRKQGGPMEPAT